MATNTELAQTAVATLADIFPGTTYGFDAGRRYHRIWKENYGQRSVDFFIEPSTGAILKAAGWKKPADKVRYTAQTPAELDQLIRAKADAHGGWLYLR